MGLRKSQEAKQQKSWGRKGSGRKHAASWRLTGGTAAVELTPHLHSVAVHHFVDVMQSHDVMVHIAPDLKGRTAEARQERAHLS